MYKFGKKLLVAALALALFSCKKDNEAPTTPEAPVNPETPVVTQPGKQALVWVDAHSNVFGTYGKFHNKTEIVKILDILKDCGVTRLVVDVKPSTGYTMYKSAHTKEFTTQNGKTKPADYVDFVIAEAKKRNMKVYLSIVTFVDGNNYGSNGFAADNPDFKEKYESIIVKNAQGQL